MARYRVRGPLAIVRLTGDAPEVYLDQGAMLPDSASPAHIEHLLAVGLIEEISADAEADGAPASPPPADPPPADPVDLSKLDLAGLRDLAAERGIDLGGVTKADDIRAAITAATATQA